MPDPDDLKARVAALDPADLAAFRQWFFDLWFDHFVGPSRGQEAEEVARMTPADAEAFDPHAFDDEALLALDKGADLPWLTPRAYDHLTMLVVAARDALQDRLVEARAHYEALWDVARRVLGSAEDAP